MMTFSIKKYFIRVTCLTVMMTLWSCAESDSEETLSGASDSKMQIMLRLPGEDETTRATETGSTEENQINNVHLFIFDSSGSKEFDIYMDLPYGGSSSDVDMSLWASEKVIIVLNTSVLSSLNASRNIHVVANVAQSKLASVTNEASLKAVLTDVIAGEIPQPDGSHPLVMHGMCQGHIFTSNVRATLSLVRNVAKVRLTVNTTDSSAGGNSTAFAPANSIAVTAADVTNRSYLLEGAGHNPAGVGYIGYTGKNVPLSSSGAATKSFVLPALYINENIGDLENGTGPALTYTPTYLLIQIPYNNGSETITDNYYKIKINEDNNCLINRNTIYDITVDIDALGGETPQTAPEISATLHILPWNEKTLISDLTQTYISVESTTLQIAGGEFNFEYATNAEVSKRTVTSSATLWLTATLDPMNDNNLKITASGAGYTGPRNGTIYIKVNDLTKVITVTQEAVPVSDGSIALNPTTIYLSTAHASRTVGLTVTNSAPWSNLINNPSIATYTPTGGTGNATLNFTRGTTAGNADFRFLNQNTLTYADVKVCNLSLESSVTELNIPGAGVTNDTEIGIVALGGDAQWKVKSKPTWMTASYSNGDLLYSAEAETTENDRSGQLVLCHVNDEDLTISISVKQSAHYERWPEFMYMVVRYRVGAHPISGQDWDMDSATFFRGTGISLLDNQGVGFGTTISGNVVYNVSYSSNVVMTFGGDNTRSGYETTYVNFKKLLELTYDLLPRYITIELYARWWTKNYSGKTYIDLDMVLYNSGEMKSYNTYDFINTLGTSAEVLNQSYNVELVIEGTTTPISPSKFTTSQHLGTITYDKLKNEAGFILHPAPTTRSLSNVITIEPLPGESKDAYAARVNGK